MAVDEVAEKRAFVCGFLGCPGGVQKCTPTPGGPRTFAFASEMVCDSCGWLHGTTPPLRRVTSSSELVMGYRTSSYPRGDGTVASELGIFSERGGRLKRREPEEVRVLLFASHHLAGVCCILRVQSNLIIRAQMILKQLGRKRFLTRFLRGGTLKSPVAREYGEQRSAQEMPVEAKVVAAAALVRTSHLMSLGLLPDVVADAAGVGYKEVAKLLAELEENEGTLIEHTDLHEWYRCFPERQREAARTALAVAHERGMGAYFQRLQSICHNIVFNAEFTMTVEVAGACVLVAALMVEGGPWRVMEGRGKKLLEDVAKWLEVPPRALRRRMLLVYDTLAALISSCSEKAFGWARQPAVNVVIGGSSERDSPLFLQDALRRYLQRRREGRYQTPPAVQLQTSPTPPYIWGDNLEAVQRFKEIRPLPARSQHSRTSVVRVKPELI
eukprot:Hpha_TRINITY_DN10221_c0_g2::TRINITY_DN10221_c0_g2_i1::g.34945::m.34945